MVCTQDASGHVSTAAAAGSQSWHSKPIRASRCTEGPEGLTGEVAATHTHTNTHKCSASGRESAGRAALTRRLSYSWIRSELWEPAPCQAHTCTLTHVCTHGRALTYTVVLCTQTLWRIVTRTSINVHGCRHKHAHLPTADTFIRFRMCAYVIKTGADRSSSS